MNKTEKELADELDAKDRLTARGYVRETCKSCGGIGTNPRTDMPCFSCDGRGFHWRAPITK